LLAIIQHLCIGLIIFFKLASAEQLTTETRTIAEAGQCARSQVEKLLAMLAFDAGTIRHINFVNFSVTHSVLASR
jgi:hypothetical protein